ncbi:MAG: hypothetical protein AAFV33_09810 [Chloroflexota bacterium]
MGTTVNFGWEVPDVGADDNTWGTILVTQTFPSIDIEMALKANKGGETYTGTHNFTGGNLTVADTPAGGSSAINKTHGDATYAPLGTTPRLIGSGRVSSLPNALGPNYRGTIDFSQVPIDSFVEVDIGYFVTAPGFNEAGIEFRYTNSIDGAATARIRLATPEGGVFRLQGRMFSNSIGQGDGFISLSMIALSNPSVQSVQTFSFGERNLRGVVSAFTAMDIYCDNASITAANSGSYFARYSATS